MSSNLLENYGKRLRIRVCGLCWQGNQLLMVNHKMGKNHTFWAPPGGGIEFGELAEEALIREFREETHAMVKPVRFMFACEFLQSPLHAIELFFEVQQIHGNIKTGYDPESPHNHQLISKVTYLDFDALMAINEDERHGIFKFVKNATEMKKLTGFYRI
jgi:8-oxo-dGTP diphosphatase